MDEMTAPCSDTHVCGPAAMAAPPPEIAATLAVLSGKWKVVILWKLYRGTTRFNELRRSIGGVSQHVLAAQLRELEADGVLTRKVFAEVPPRVEYTLTPHGRALGEVLRALSDWGHAHLTRA
jgi:DNA-binding HxlR family transcriptional regulator